MVSNNGLSSVNMEKKFCPEDEIVKLFNEYQFLVGTAATIRTIVRKAFPTYTVEA